MSDKYENFNDEQRKAIFASTFEDVLIAAGAGSGKTKTLSVRVNKLMEEGQLKPSEILVLTFTNNAAHEMKERIIATFNKDNPIGAEMLSSHIQTFDSFSAYLVSKYAGKLGISDKISLADENVIASKTQELLDEVLDEYYKSPILKEKLFNSIKKFNSVDERNTKKVVLDLKKRLEGMLPVNKENFINHYDETFNNREFFDKCVFEYASYYKKQIELVLREAFINYKYFDEIQTRGDVAIKDAFDDIRIFSCDIGLLPFDESAYDIYQAVLKCYKKDGYEFIKECKNLYLNNTFSIKRKIDTPSLAAYKTIRTLFSSKQSPFALVSSLSDDLDFEFEKYMSFKDDIKLLFEIISKLEAKLDDYKKISNSFTFSDISIMALNLMTHPKYKDVAEEVRNQFKYIMVDEYQDTNDFQEAFINSLLEPKDDGTCSHLFCVGDAKQAIYGFRNSKVELFRARQGQYSKGKENQYVIDMNKNYRSGPGLLKDINYIFKYYMTLNHGGIDFNVSSEQLDYDYKVNLYKEPYDNFHVKRIVAEDSKDDDREPIKWEIYAIIHDIKTKIESGYQVYDRGSEPHIRPCTYSDFAILMRVTKGYQHYIDAFKEAGIPLNNKIKTNLYEVDPIIVIQSLIDLVCYRKYGIEVDVKHLFASVMRSYLYCYSDNDLFAYLTSESLDMILESELIKKIDQFILDNEESSLSETYQNLITSFEIITKLYRLDSVDDVISKVESLHSMILAQEASGDDLKDLMILFKNIDRYNLDLSSETVLSVNNAVDLMTIHGSKGLERKIVYMPYSFNKKTGGNPMAAADYKFSEQYGILLPYYNYDPNKVDENGNVVPVTFKTIPQLAFELNSNVGDEEINEHVRLFYVALTRAENTLYIVGDPDENDDACKKDENLYGMLSYLPHYPKVNKEFIEGKIKKGVISQDQYNDYLSIVDCVKNGLLRFTQDELGKSNYKIYRQLYDSLLTKKMNEIVSKCLASLETSIFVDYLNQFESGDKDILAKFYAAIVLGENVKTYDELEKLINEGTDYYEYDEDAKELIPMHGPYCSFGDEEVELTKDNLLTELNTFKDNYVNDNFEYFGYRFDTSKKSFDKIKELKDIWFVSLLKSFGDVYNIYNVTYESDEYEDIVEVFDERSFSIANQDTKEDKPHSLYVDDSDISFEIRTHMRASKANITDEDLPTKEILERGTYLHRLLELTDLVSKDTSFIQNRWDRKLIDNVLSNDIFNDLGSAKVFKEYGYYDDLLSTTGFIDLLYIKGDEYYIVDYKSKHTDDDDYVNQLNTYKRNIKKIFNVTDDSKIHTCLLSIIDNKIYSL